MDPVLDTPTAVELPRVRVESPIPAGFQMEWASGDNGDIEFEVTSGAGLGSSYMVLTVRHKEDRKVIGYEVVDMRRLVPAWIQAFLADGPTTEEHLAERRRVQELRRQDACQHDYPDEWDYTYNPAGSKTCRKCGHTIHD
jgi:hypothetical protein